MHVGFLTSEYPEKNQPNGGIGTSIYHLAQALLKEGIKVSIFIYDHSEHNISESGNFKIHYIKQIGYKFGGFYFYRKYLERYLNNYILKEDIDVLEVPDWTGISAFMNLKCPVILKLHGSDAYFCHLEDRKQKAKNRFFERQAFKKANGIIAVSNFVGKESNTVFNLQKQYKVIHNLIPLQDFVPDHNSIKANTILYFGTLIRKKGVLELAGIFNEVVNIKPEAKLIIAGKDANDIFENKSTLTLFRKKLSTKAEAQFEYRGVLDYTEIQQLIKHANVLVLPSFAEAFPMTWLETMALEKPLISSDIGWAKEIMIDGETGFTIHPKNHVLYAEKIVSVLDNPKLRLRLGENARKRLENNFSAETIVQKTIDFYKEII